MTETKSSEIVIKKDVLETRCAILNNHYKTPHSFVAYLPGENGKPVRVLYDKSHGYLFVNDIWVYSMETLLAVLREGPENHRQYYPKDNKNYVKIFNSLDTRNEHVLVEREALKEFLEHNAVCKYHEDWLCTRSCVFWYCDDDCRCIYEKCHAFREFVENNKEYVHIIKSKQFYIVKASCRFFFEGFNERSTWYKDVGEITYKDALIYYLKDCGHEIKIDEDGSLIAKKGYTFSPKTKYTIKIDSLGNGEIVAKAYTEDDWDSISVLLCAEGERSSVVEAMRYLCVMYDKQIRPIPKKEWLKDRCREGRT